jgi:hypothetical protein
MGVNRVLVAGCGVLMLGLLSGCVVRPAASADDPLRKIDPTSIERFDPSNTFLAERAVPMKDLAAVLKALGTLDAHHPWPDKFLADTQKEVQGLVTGGRMDSRFHTKHQGKTYEVVIRLIKVSERTAMVRLLGNEKALIDEAQKKMNAVALSETPEAPVRPENRSEDAPVGE